MAFATTPRRLYRKNSSADKKSVVPSLVVHINKSGIVSTPINGYTYRTEAYLQQRENQNVDKSPPGTKTTWKNLMQQKRIFDNDQAEIDRVLSTIDSIHGSFNRSLLMPYNQVYSSLYGDDDKSARLMKTFCQRQDHYIKENDDDNNHHTQETSSSCGNFQDTDSDFDNSEDEEEKKKSYDSGYGSVMPRRHFSRESFVDISQHLENTTNSLL